MKLTELLAKIAKSEDLTDAEKTFLSEYDAEKASNDAVAAYRRKAEEKLTKAEQERDELKAQVEAIGKKLAEKDNAGKSKDELAQGQIKTLSEQLAALTGRLEQTDKEKAQLARQTAINSMREKAGIKFIDGVSEEIMCGAFASSFEGIDDLNDAALVKPVIERFVAANKAAIADATGFGSGGAPHVGSGGTLSAGENPFAEKTHNLTKQGELIKTNPAEAQRMAAAAGIKLEV